MSHSPQNRRSANAAISGSPRPVEPETPIVPAHRRIRYKISKSFDTDGPQALEPNPEVALPPAEVNSPLVPVSDHRLLLPLRQDAGMEAGAERNWPARVEAKK